MNPLKYIRRGRDGKSALISGDFLARSIAGRTTGVVGVGEDSTMYRFTLPGGARFKINKIRAKFMTPVRGEINFRRPRSLP